MFAALRSLEEYSAQNLAHCAWALAKLGAVPMLEALEAVCEEATSCCQESTPQELSMLMFAMATFRFQPPCAMLVGVRAWVWPILPDRFQNRTGEVGKTTGTHQPNRGKQ